MKTRVSKKGEKILKDPKARRAVMDFVIHSGRLQGRNKAKKTLRVNGTSITLKLARAS